MPALAGGRPGFFGSATGLAGRLGAGRMGARGDQIRHHFAGITTGDQTFTHQGPHRPRRRRRPAGRRCRAPRLGHADHVGGQPRRDARKAVPVDFEGLEITRVHADDLSAGLQRAVGLFLGVTSTSAVIPATPVRSSIDFEGRLLSTRRQSAAACRRHGIGPRGSGGANHKVPCAAPESTRRRAPRPGRPASR